MPAFNSAPTIVESLDSIVLANLGRGDEIIVTDDGSADETGSLVEQYAAQHPEARIKLIRHEKNRGGGPARNTAVENAIHDRIFCLDSDNVLPPGSVAALSQLMSETGADITTFGGLRFFDMRVGSPTHEWVFKEGLVTFADLLAGNINPASSGNYLYTRQCWETAGKYPESGLDTWGFGLRQLASGAKMMTKPGTYYWHRWGHESYAVRWFGANDVGARAYDLLAPFAKRLSEESRNWLASDRGLQVWFEQLAKHPLTLRDMPRGVNGRRLRAKRTPRQWLRYKLGLPRAGH